MEPQAKIYVEEYYNIDFDRIETRIHLTDGITSHALLLIRPYDIQALVHGLEDLTNKYSKSKDYRLADIELIGELLSERSRNKREEGTEVSP